MCKHYTQPIPGVHLGEEGQGVTFVLVWVGGCLVSFTAEGGGAKVVR